MEKINKILMQKYPFVVMEFPLPFDSCKPNISKDSLVHHYEYLKQYIDEINIILSQYEQYQNFTIKDIFLKHEKIDIKIKSKLIELAGGIFNHEFIFYLLAPPLKLMPGKKLLKKINNDFGSYEKFIEKFTEVCFENIGSRYTGLVLDEFNNLKIVCFEKESTPYMFPLKPLYMLDLFEHAYYLDKKEKVRLYIKDAFECIDFKKIDDIFDSYIN